MSRERASRRIPVIVSLLIGLMLMIMPLPGWAEAFRPNWLALFIIFWAMQLPRTWSIGWAWIIGIVLDVSLGTLLGQHALAFAVIAYITVRSHLLMRVFPLSQLTVTVSALLALCQFLLFWINGVADTHAPAVYYWGPVLSSTLIWPLVHAILSGVRYRARTET